MQNNETVLRILRMVEHGALTPEEAADLLDALYVARPPDDHETHSETHQATTTQEETKTKESARGLFDQILKTVEEAVRTTGEAVRGVNWRELGETIRSQTQRGLEEMKRALEQLEQGEWVRGKQSHDFERQFPLPIQPGQTLTIELPAGDVFITGGFDEGRVGAEITLRGAEAEQLRSLAETYSMVVEHTEGGLTLRLPELGNSITQRADLRIAIPRQVNLNLRIVHKGDLRVEKLDGKVHGVVGRGDVSLAHLRGSVDLQIASGDVNLLDIHSETVRVNMVHGDLILRQVRTDTLQVNLTNGDLEAEELDARDISVETVNGDQQIRLMNPIQGVVRLTTVKGDLLLQVPDRCDCTVSMQTLSGDIECKLELSQQERTRNSLSGVAGSGTGNLVMETVHGDLWLQLPAYHD